MEVQYRQSFLRDLKKLKKQPIYDKLFEFAFQILPSAQALTDLPGVKALTGHTQRYRIRIATFRIGIAVQGDVVELVRVLDRREFYRYFP